MKADSNIPGYPFNFDAIPRWIEPNLLEFDARISRQKLKIISLYALSCVVGIGWGAILGGLVIGMFNEFSTKSALVFLVFWATLSAILGPLFGLAVLWDFTKAKKKHAANASASKKAEIQQSDPLKKVDE